MAIDTTMDQLLQELMQRRSTLQDEMDKVDEGIRALSSLKGVGQVTLAGDSWDHLGIVEASRKLLAEKGHPMSTRELADEMIRRGVKTKSKRFTATVYVVLRDSPWFEFDKKLERWKLKVKGEVTPLVPKP